MLSLSSLVLGLNNLCRRIMDKSHQQRKVYHTTWDIRRLNRCNIPYCSSREDRRPAHLQYILQDRQRDPSNLKERDRQQRSKHRAIQPFGRKASFHSLLYLCKQLLLSVKQLNNQYSS